MDAQTSISTLWETRFGTPCPTADAPMPDAPLPDAVARLLDRRVTRRYRPDSVPEALLALVLAAAQSAPSKSDLQQYAIVVLRDPARIRRISDWIGEMPWITQAPVFLVFCADARRGARLCGQHDLPHANRGADTVLNAAMDATLALACCMSAADALGLGTCPISYVRNPIERVSLLLGLPDLVFPVAGLTLGFPAERRAVSMRLPPSVVVHHERYDDSDMADAVHDYDARRRERQKLAANGLKNNDLYGPKEDATWSENLARQLSVPERFGFGAYLRLKGFDLG